MSSSWGADEADYSLDCVTSDQFMTDFEDSVILYAAGNDGDEGAESVVSPCTAKNVVCVGAAMNDYESWKDIYGKGLKKSLYNRDNIAYFSSQGPTEDGLMKPDILGVGYNIQSSMSDSTGGDDHCEMIDFAGTSMATPITAGATALIRQFFTDGYYKNNTVPFDDVVSTIVSFEPTGSLLKACLIHSGSPMTYYVDIDNNKVSVTWPDYYQGFGRVQLDQVLNWDDSFSLFALGATDEVGDANLVVTFTYLF